MVFASVNDIENVLVVRTYVMLLYKIDLSPLARVTDSLKEQHIKVIYIVKQDRLKIFWIAIRILEQLKLFEITLQDIPIYPAILNFRC